MGPPARNVVNFIEPFKGQILALGRFFLQQMQIWLNFECPKGARKSGDLLQEVQTIDRRNSFANWKSRQENCLRTIRVNCLCGGACFTFLNDSRFVDV